MPTPHRHVLSLVEACLRKAVDMAPEKSVSQGRSLLNGEACYMMDTPRSISRMRWAIVRRSLPKTSTFFRDGRNGVHGTPYRLTPRPG
jgi:hypothetical protein